MSGVVNVAFYIGGGECRGGECRTIGKWPDFEYHVGK